MKFQLTLIIVILTSVFECKSPAPSYQTEENKATSTAITSENVEEQLQDEKFLQFYEKTVAAINTKDTLAFNQLIYANYGLYIIENPGAMPEVTKLYDIKKYKSKITEQHFFNLPFNAITMLPIEDTLPKVICAAKIYNKEGCFYAKLNPLNESQLWNYAQLNEKEIQAINAVSTYVQITVINTKNYTFYFSFIDDKWWLSFIDLRIPCQA